MTDRLDDPQVYLPDVWANHARYRADKTAIVCGDTRLSWKTFNGNMNRVANALKNAGFGRGDKIAVVMGNAPVTLEVMFGIVKAGACVVPLSGMLTSEQLVHLIDDCDATAVFTDDHLGHLVRPGRDKLRKVRPNGFYAVNFEAVGWQSFAERMAEASEEEPGVTYRMDDPFNIIYSSGTTGLPKGIVQTHRARQHWSYSNALEMRFHEEARALTTTALYSNGTWFMVLPPLFVGATVHILPSFDPGAFLETVERERITHSFMVPAQYIATLQHPRLNEANLSSLEMLLSAGSPLRQDTKEEARRRLTPQLYELYGFSEGFATILKPAYADTKPGSVGTPVLGFEMHIIDDDGTILPRGEIGEIVGTGGGLMKEYYNRPDATAEIIWRDDRGRTFVRSGDIGRMDDDGFLYILDRKKDMIISGGFNVFPADIEEVVGQHPAVADVTVIGVPHEKWGEVPLALVIRAKDTSASPDEIRDWANARLAKTQRLAGVEFRDEFPRNALGKVLKKDLRQPYWTDQK
ncbi:MAG: AMP-dependent synthetase [Alphaproteobacteria bacterium]|nr:MAG: AMP-dependent synthetase [Alphaproteobacteria bacterium]